jgi:hypothetical protein
VDLLKIDVEGSEVEVLKGARNTLARTRRIVLEYHRQPLLSAVDGLLQSAGFRQRREGFRYPANGAGVAFYER